MIELIDQGQPIRTAYPNYSAHAFALGDRLTMVALSGEVVVDYAVRLRKELGGQGRALWVAAYANDVVGYIPSVRVLNEGGYEGSNPSTAAPGPPRSPGTSSPSSSRRPTTWSTRSGRSNDEG
jgi:hypothetical protein